MTTLNDLPPEVLRLIFNHVYVLVNKDLDEVKTLLQDSDEDYYARWYKPGPNPLQFCSSNPLFDSFCDYRPCDHYVCGVAYQVFVKWDRVRKEKKHAEFTALICGL